MCFSFKPGVCVCARARSCTHVHSYMCVHKHALLDPHIGLNAHVWGGKSGLKPISQLLPPLPIDVTNSDFILLSYEGLWMCVVLRQARVYYVDVVPSPLQEPEYLRIGDFCLISFGLAVFNWWGFVIVCRHQIKFTKKGRVSPLSVCYSCTVIKVYHCLLPILSKSWKELLLPS